jgi:hypothetical protein
MSSHFYSIRRAISLLFYQSNNNFRKVSQNFLAWLAILVPGLFLNRSPRQPPLINGSGVSFDLSKRLMTCDCRHLMRRAPGLRHATGGRLPKTMSNAFSG